MTTEAELEFIIVGGNPEFLTDITLSV